MSTARVSPSSRVQPNPVPGVLCLALALASCGGGSSGDPDNRGDFTVATISTGRGTIYPYRIRQVDIFGNPTPDVVNIEDIDTLKENLTDVNGVLPVATLGATAELPDGTPGNQFLSFEFTHKLDVESILSPLLANQSNAGLTGALNVLGYDTATEATSTLLGRGFVNGYTYFNEAGVLVKVKAVEENGEFVRILDARAAGFPNYQGAAALVGKKSFVFVADNDNNLQTLDVFPDDKLIRLVVSNAVRDTEGDPLDLEVTTATTVGDDTEPPQVIGFTAVPDITPGNGQANVDPTTQIQVRFNKPVQPGDVGAFFDPAVFTPPLGGLTISVTAAAQTFGLLYSADPFSYADLCNYRITPAYNLPGQASVTVTVQNTTIRSLNQVLVGTAVNSSFTTSDGPGIVNAPVAPEAIYVGVGGATPGVSVIDLNGFGQGTGELTSTRFPLNPNIGQPGVNPALSPGTTNLDAGSGGALTLVKDSQLNTLLIRAPLVGSVTDIQVGAPLDLVFNNENINVNASASNQVNAGTGLGAAGNCIFSAPHPNPPRLVFPPPNPDRAIFGEEPTVSGGVNLLQQGNPFSSVQGELGIFGTSAITFVGPAPPPNQPPPPPQYTPFNVRQQVGHFLYVLDSENRRVLVLNSNRFTVLDTINFPGPVDLSISPNLKLMAVANYAGSTVSFLDIDPLSSRFHQIVGEARVQAGPIKVSWQPDGEDVIAVCQGSNFLSIISAADLSVRRSVSGFLNNPVDVAVTPRFVATGFTQGVYYAYVLNANGSVSIYESGPDGVNGIGFNDMVGQIPNVTFPRARGIRYDYASQNGSAYIGHIDENGLGVVSRLDLTSSPTGPQPLNANSGGFVLPPTFRQKEYGVNVKFGGTSATTPVRDLLSGNAVADVCTDELINFGGAAGQATQFNTGLSLPSFRHSGKDGVKGTAPAVTPRLLFVAYSDVGRIDVFEIISGRKITSIQAPGVRSVSGYWRQ